jgi:site-specific DNA-methyltransferase (adenine-specific)
MRLDKLIPYENNARRNDKAVDAVAASIADFGFKVPIVVDPKNEIIAGHTRLKAAQRLGLDTVPVVVANDLTEEQVKAFRLADNKAGEIAVWDEELLRTELKDLEEQGLSMFDYGFTKADFDVDINLDETEQTETNPKTLRSKLGDVWQLGEHRLLVGDSTDKGEIKRLVAGEEIDLLQTDAPYGVGYTRSKEGFEREAIVNDDLDPKSLQEFLSKAFKNADSVMRKGAAFYVWHADKLRAPFTEALKEAGLQYKQILVWVKGGGGTLRRSDYQWAHEPCLYGWKRGASHYFSFDRTQKTYTEYKKGDLLKLTKHQLVSEILSLEDLQEPRTVMHAPKPIKSPLHPTQKPQILIRRQIANSTKRGDKVLDIFAGSGTTILACEHLKRKCYACELEPKYADVIIGQWERLTGEKAVKSAV